MESTTLYVVQCTGEDGTISYKMNIGWGRFRNARFFKTRAGAEGYIHRRGWRTSVMEVRATLL